MVCNEAVRFAVHTQYGSGGGKGDGVGLLFGDNAGLNEDPTITTESFILYQ